jgi:hypothetical protein
VYERGQFIQSAGSNTVLNNLYLGMFTYTDPGESSLQYAGSGDYILYDGLLDVKGSEFVGYQGKGGGVLHDNGTHNVAGELYLGYGSGSVGIYDLKSGTLNATSLNIGGYQGTGQFNQTGGTNAVTDNIVVGRHVSGADYGPASGFYALTDGELSAANEYVQTKGNFSQAGGNNTTELLAISTGGSYTLEGGALDVQSLVNYGLFEYIGGAASLGTADNYGFLTGTGTITGDVNNHGILLPGTSPGTLSIEGDYAQDNSGSLIIEIAGYLQGTEYDFLDISGNASLNGTLDVTLDFGLAEFDPLIAACFGILHADNGISGTFSSYLLPTLAGGKWWEVSYTVNDVFLNVRGNQTPVPEPATMFLMVTGLAGIIGIGRKTKA